MANEQGSSILRHLRQLVVAQYPCQQSDKQLLQQFIADRDDMAFAVIVQKHGPMVLGVCRNVLHHQQDAEDAFQAVFLVLARKANTVRKHEALASWLHGVAYRLSLKVRNRRRNQFSELSPGGRADPFASNPVDDITMRELRGIFHEELNRLSDKYRMPLLLCYWEGKTRDEAAEQLGMTAGAFKKCLERARHLLGSRLARRGLVPSAAFFATLFSSSGVQAALPNVLIHSTAHAAVAFAVGKTVGVSTAAAALANGAILTMNLTKWTTSVLAILLFGVLSTGLGLGGYQLVQGNPGGQPPGNAEARGKKPPAKVAQPGKTDKERIVGTWCLTKSLSNGAEVMPADLTSFVRFSFSKEGNLDITILEDVKKGKYKIVGPGKIDLTGMGGKDTGLGIYEFAGKNRLTICVSTEPKERATAFDAAKGSGNVLFSLVRAKLGEEKLTPEQIAKKKAEIDQVREAAARKVSVNNLQQIGLAMHQYHDVYKHFPANAIYSKDGKTPLLSWRVAILPFIEQEALYKEFKLEEPWDSAHNKKLIAKMPKIYVAGAASKAKEGETHYQVITGPDTVFDGAKGMKIQNITDGTRNTLLALEAKNPVIWTRPADLTLPKDKTKLPAVGTVFSNGFHVLMCDGSWQFLPANVMPAMFRALVTPAAGD